MNKFMMELLPMAPDLCSDILAPRISDFASCGRLDWVLGLADDAPEKRISLSFSPLLCCLERAHPSVPNDDVPARLTAARPLNIAKVIRTTKSAQINSLALDAFYDYDDRLERPTRADKAL